MKENYCLTGTKVVMRRLFKTESKEILNCFENYKKLYYNPITEKFVEDIFLYGEIWGAFWKEEMIGCCYYFPLNSKFFADTPFYGAIKDFVFDIEKYFYMGYVGVNDKAVTQIKNDKNLQSTPSVDGLYQAFLNIGQMQAFRRGLKNIIHAVPVKLNINIEPLFIGGYSLIKMRGLENLVVHYIFEKPVFPNEELNFIDGKSNFGRVKICNTKKVSALLESGYHIVDIDKNADEFLAVRLVSND